MVPYAAQLLLPTQDVSPYLNDREHQALMAGLADLGRALNDLPDRYARTSAGVDDQVRSAIAYLVPLYSKLPDRENHIARLTELQRAVTPRAIGDAVEPNSTR